MPTSHFVILYVADPIASATFYARLLGQAPIESSPGFAMFGVAPGLMLGLWARADVQPAVETRAGGGEFAFALDGNAEVDAWHARWRDAGCRITQAPVAMDFGYTFVAEDPDGHRLRVFAPTGA
jgi:predicted enzyme related to lactoylglutathione lyase